MRLSATLQLHVAVLLFGTAGLMGKLVDLPAMQLVLGRTLIGACALALFMLLRKRDNLGRWWPAGTNTTLAIPLALSGVVLVVHWWSFFYAIQLAGVGVALVGFSAFPVFVTALEALFQKRMVRAFDGFMTSLVVFGLWLVAPDIDWHNSAFQGLAWGVISGALFAVLALQNRALVRVFGGIRLGFWQQGMAGLCCLLVMGPSLAQIELGVGDIAKILVLGVVLTAVPHVLFIASLKHIGAHTAAIITSLEPIYGIALAWLLLADQPALTTLLGAAIILSAVVLTQRYQVVRQADRQSKGSA